MIIDDIVSYLCSTYCPKAILLHGSRARGDTFERSDYDLALITENPNQLNPEYYQGYALDIGGISTEEMILKAGNTPVWPCVVLFDDGDRLRARLAKKTQDAFLQGPAALTREERENRRNFSKRLIDRIQGRGDDPMVRFYYLSDFYQRVLRHWCELNQKWALSVHLLLPLIVKEDRAFHQILQDLWSEDYQNAVEQMHQYLFKQDS
jgi:predicted nucleotidyltransferase